MTMFPIFADPKRYPPEAKKRLTRVPEDVRTLIEKLQPYHTSNPTKSGLWALQILDAADKHQLLTVTAVTPLEGNLKFWVPSGVTPTFDVRGFDVPLVHDAVVAELTFRQPTPNLNVQAYITPDVAFGESLGFGPRTGVLKSLPQIIEDIERVRVYFKQTFNVADE